jgi:hypothetical protein
MPTNTPISVVVSSGVAVSAKSTSITPGDHVGVFNLAADGGANNAGLNVVSAMGVDVFSSPPPYCDDQEGVKKYAAALQKFHIIKSIALANSLAEKYRSFTIMTSYAGECRSRR